MDVRISAARLARATLHVSIFVSLAAAQAAPVQPAAVASPAEVTVIGQRSRSSPGIDAARAELARVPGGVSVVSNEEFEHARASNLRDVFALTPGVFVQPRFGAEEARLSIRGSGLQRTFHMRGINLLQDGVPITLADGSADFQAVEPMALAYVEVLRGANALEFGSTALGGAINFVSPSGYNAAAFRPRLEVGSFGYRRALAGVSGVRGAADYFLSASAYSQDGFREWSRQQNHRLFGNAGFRLREGLETRFFIAAVQSDSQLPGAVTKADLLRDPRRANAGNVSGRHKRDFDLYRLANRTVFTSGSRQVELSAAFSHKDLTHPIFQVLRQRSNDYSAGIRYLDELAVAGRANRIILGLRQTWNAVDDDRFANRAGEAGDRTAHSRQHSRNVTAYAQDELAVLDHWTLIAGVQWTHSTRAYRDLFLSDGEQSLRATYQHVSPKLGFLWRPDARWSVFGNVSDSFEPPSFGELSGTPRAEPLRSQAARTLELGTRGEAGRVRWDVALYAANVRNELLSLNTPDGQPLGTVNAARTVHRGVEAGVDIDLTDSLSWRSAYLLSDFRFDDDPVYANRQLPGIPGHFLRGELVWRVQAPWTLALSCELSPEEYPVDMANSLFAEPYAIWGMRLTRDLERGLSWFIEGRNLANRKYAATTGVIADARGLDGPQFLPGDARAVYFGVDWRRN